MNFSWAKHTARAAAFFGVLLSLAACETADWGKPAPQAQAVRLDAIAPGTMIRVEGETQTVEVLDYYLAASNEACVRYIGTQNAPRIACRAGTGPFRITGNDLTGRAPAFAPRPQALSEAPMPFREMQPIVMAIETEELPASITAATAEQPEEPLIVEEAAPAPPQKTATAPRPPAAPKTAPRKEQTAIVVKPHTAAVARPAARPVAAPVVKAPAAATPDVIAQAPVVKPAPPAPTRQAAGAASPGLAPYDESKNSERAP